MICVPPIGWDIFLTMKYRQLTKEQFESLSFEFAQFLATQKIDVDTWKTIKEMQPRLAEEKMNLFSDLVWEDVLNKVTYLDHFSSNVVNLLKLKRADLTYCYSSQERY